MANVVPAHKTTISVADPGQNPSYTEISQILSVDGASITVGEVETTNLSSERKTYRPGLSDPGEVSFEIQYDPQDTEHKNLKGLAETPALKLWRITYATSPKKTYHDFEGFLTGFSPGAGGPEEDLSASITIRVNSEVTESTEV